ncbi:outer membrane protein assembly factor BamE [Aureimonas sp. ME7]|uniref:outer membrane protein assembly factor BamE n=1 Tax=Aureimonas sp. ME7 TaxID=2744252 RepID=UPI0015F42F1D|nr:outer membrane protein assembly factor BamE [Aureimonas sp. ME7]
MVLATGACAMIALTGCQTSQVYNQGYIVDEQALAQVPVGSSRDQVLLALGTPSTTATFDNEVFYYISQKRVRQVAFMKPKLVDQRILAIYFGKDNTVRQIANYGLQDGKVFDFISRTTPTGGRDTSFLGSILSDEGPGKGNILDTMGGRSSGISPGR